MRNFVLQLKYKRLELYVSRSSRQKQMIRLTSIAYTFCHNIIWY